jgi:hypothetical protein
MHRCCARLLTDRYPDARWIGGACTLQGARKAMPVQGDCPESVFGHPARSLDLARKANGGAVTARTAERGPCSLHGQA